MKKKIFPSGMIALIATMLLFGLTADADSAAAEEPLIVTASAAQKLKLVIAQPQLPAGAATPDQAAQLVELLRFDLDFAGPFAVEIEKRSEQRGIKPGEFDFAPLKAAGAKYLLLSSYGVTNAQLTLECRLYHVESKQLLTSKRYTARNDDLRIVGHTFSDEILNAVTGKPGPFAGRVLFVSRKSGNKELAVMDYDGHKVHALTANGSININPALSPSGKEAVYISYKNGAPDLYRKALVSGAESRLTNGKGSSISPAYSPDGKKIAVSLSSEGNAEIYTIGTDGKGLKRLTRNPAIDISPSWSPDGTKLLFVSDRLGNPQLFVMDADGANAHRLTTTGNYNVSPQWSPTGDRIAFARSHDGEFQIFTITPDGGNEVRLTSQGRNDHPHWSPDGRFIIFDSNRQGKDAIFIMRGDGSQQTRISEGKGETEPSWSVR